MGVLRYGLIGCGSMGKGHIGAVSILDGADIVALADPHEPSLSGALGELGRDVPTYPDAGEMMRREELDAVIVATPNYTHADLVCKGLGAGLHVLSEKPMATTVEDCTRIAETAAGAPGIYMIGLENRYAPQTARQKELLDEGRIGRVRQMWCKEFRGPWMFKVDNWITQQRCSGGALVEKDCHHFDLFNYFCGSRPVRVTGFGTMDLVYGRDRFGVEPDVLDNAQVVVQYENGALAALMLCMYCDGYHEVLELGTIGTDGYFQMSWGGRSVRWHTRDGKTDETFECPLPESVRQTSHSGYVYLEHVAFGEAIREGKEPMTDASAAWWATVVPLAAEQAVREGRTIEIAELATPPPSVRIPQGG